MERLMRETYNAYADLIDENEFNKLFSSIPIEKQKEFGRASLMYQRALKCMSCDPDIGMALLCSAVEAVSQGTSKPRRFRLGM